MASSEPLSAQPKSMEKATLSPTERTSFSVSPNLFRLIMERKRKPGKKVRKIKPDTCLKTGMSRRIEILVTATTAAIEPNHLTGADLASSAVTYASCNGRYKVPALFPDQNIKYP